MAALLVTGLAQAAAVSWSTGKIYVPNVDGSFGGEVNATTGAYLATVFFFTDAAQTTPVITTGTTDDSTTSLSDALSGTTGDQFANGGTYYAYVFVSTAAGDYTMTSGQLQFTVGLTGNGNINFTTSGLMPGEWTVVPEPTSMALLGLGIAAFGLRRKIRK